ncbi:MAG: hypothetical protein PUJ51_00970 [Clostridiales bacterium]|uniref:hypothetical protein n=1 Tax=Terrisporobacter sp. TaxID=1965305 RepID=UPI002A520479|nr:hypothetical protein [Terrisporobacter sp.]MDD7753063.1 hypothetical protein [Clostridiales bacterium]MDY3777422.1 hypothetical protein [Candidatus Onthovivens sp.]MDY4135473.1 hypothetical protein [Terrisporobacter sp.]
MKVIIIKASDWDYREVKEINTFEELLKIYHSLIIDSDKNAIDIYKEKNEKIDCIVTIYDDYVE